MSRQEILEQVLNMVAMSYKKDVAELSEIENELDVALMLADASACATISDLVDLIEEEM